MSFKQLKSLLVETASGTPLGRVNDAIVELDGQIIAQYVVKSSRLSSKELLVHHDQVIRFETNKMVVDDALASVRVYEEKKDLRGISPEPVAMREIQ